MFTFTGPLVVVALGWLVPASGSSPFFLSSVSVCSGMKNVCMYEIDSKLKSALIVILCIPLSSCPGSNMQSISSVCSFCMVIWFVGNILPCIWSFVAVHPNIADIGSIIAAPCSLVCTVSGMSVKATVVV